MIISINGAYYAEELGRLNGECEKEERKVDSSVLLLHDNAPANTSQVAMASATECGFEVLLHPPYSPDLAPSDFYLFPKLKTNLRGRNFGSNEGDIYAVNGYLGDQDEVFYFEGISKLKQQWRKCVKM